VKFEPGGVVRDQANEDPVARTVDGPRFKGDPARRLPRGGGPAADTRPPGGDGELPPGPRASGFRQSLQWFRAPVRYMERSRARYGDVFSVRLGPLKRACFISNPEGVRTVLTGHPDLLRMGPTNALFRPVLGSGSLFLLDGAEHRRHRSLIMPAFHRSNVQRLSELIAELAEREVASWPLGEPFQLYGRMRTLTLEVILNTVFGAAEGERQERLRALMPRLLDLVQRPFAVLPWFQYELGGSTPFGRLMVTLREIDEVLYREIRARRLDPEIGSRDDILSLLARARPEEGDFMTDREIRDEVITLLIAGHETTATAISWSFERLLRHPDALRRLGGGLAGGRGGAYLDVVIKESLRQRPVLPITARKLTGPMELCGYTFPEGWTLMPCVYLLHHEPEVYPEPHEFRPERFLDDDPAPHAWIPFGGGVRHCIGSNLALAVMKVVLATTIPRARLVPGSRDPEPIVRRNFTLGPGRGATVVLESRHSPVYVPADRPGRRERATAGDGGEGVRVNVPDEG
jgi:cytochrome P450